MEKTAHTNKFKGIARRDFLKIAGDGQTGKLDTIFKNEQRGLLNLSVFLLLAALARRGYHHSIAKEGKLDDS